MTTISLNGYTPDANERTPDAPIWPSELDLRHDGTVLAIYPDGEKALYSDLPYCLRDHQLDTEHIVSWLDDEGEPLAASLVATLTDPERADRAQAAAQVAAQLRQERPTGIDELRAAVNWANCQPEDEHNRLSAEQILERFRSAWA